MLFARLLTTQLLPWTNHDPPDLNGSGCKREPFDVDHDEMKRDNMDNELVVPRWGVLLMVFIPLSLFFLGVTIFYLNRNRRHGLRRTAPPVELQDIIRASTARHHRTSTPISLSGLYGPRAVSGPGNTSPRSEVTLFPGRDASSMDRGSLAALPRHSADTGEPDAGDWETVAGPTRDNTFNDAFAQHQLDEARREAERRDRLRRLRTERSPLEVELERRRQRNRRQSSSSGSGSGSNRSRNDNDKSHTNPCTARGAAAAADDDDSKTDAVLASSTDVVHRHSRAAPRLSLTRQPRAPPTSDRLFPSDLSEMDNYTEVTITDDPFVGADDASHNNDTVVRRHVR